MELTRKDAVRMFQSIGYLHLPAKWDKEKLESKLNKLPSLLSGTPNIDKEILADVEAENPKTLVGKICQAIGQNDRITVTPWEVPGENKIDVQGETEMKTKEKKQKKQVVSLAAYEGRPEPKKTGKKASKPMKHGSDRPVNVKPKASTGGQGKDAFGSRMGSKVAQINAMLSHKHPITMAQIKEATGDTHYNHMKKLVKAGKVERTDDGWVLAK